MFVIFSNENPLSPKRRHADGFATIDAAMTFFDDSAVVDQTVDEDGLFANVAVARGNEIVLFTVEAI